MKAILKHHIGYVLVTILIAATAIAATACSSAAAKTTPAATSTPTTTPPAATAPATNQPQRQGIMGTLQSIDGNTLTLTNAQGTQVTVNLDSSTSIQKTVTGTLADLQQGDNLIVTGTADANGNITANTISVRPAGQGFTGRNPGGTFTPRRTPNPSATPPAGGSFGNFTTGTLNAINGESLTLSTQQGNQITVTVTDATVIDKTVAGTTSDLQPGDTLMITETQDASGNTIAGTISIRPQGQGFPTAPPGTGTN
ncbi:MAG: DUF5666 domain-containing protein [Dehalococcoidales bacterium]